MSGFPSTSTGLFLVFRKVAKSAIQSPHLHQIFFFAASIGGKRREERGEREDGAREGAPPAILMSESLGRPPLPSVASSCVARGLGREDERAICNFCAWFERGH